MTNLMLRGGQIAGLIGLVMMAVAIVTRMTGHYVIGNFESGSMLIAGIGAAVAGCFGLLWSIAARN